MKKKVKATLKFKVLEGNPDYKGRKTPEGVKTFSDVYDFTVDNGLPILQDGDACDRIFDDITKTAGGGYSARFIKVISLKLKEVE